MKTETKHTPGRWRTERNGANSIKVLAGAIPICVIDHWGQRESDLTASLKPAGQPEANAALIASAPDLLAERDERRTAMADIVRILGHGCHGLEHTEIAPKVADLLTQRDELRHILSLLLPAAQELERQAVIVSSREGQYEPALRNAATVCALAFDQARAALAKCEPQQPPKGWQEIEGGPISNHPFGNANCTCPNLPCQVHDQEPKAKVIADCDKTIREATQERDGLVWLIDHGMHTENVIHYAHENDGGGLFCFGWRAPVVDSIRDSILEIISEFPFAYRIKCADGKVLEGGIG